VVVGSGAGGGVVAAELVAGGLDGVVLEAGGYFDQSDFPCSELWAYQNLYLRGGPFASADRNVTLLAGHTLGGGTTVNWSNSVRPPERVLAVWAGEHGMTDVAGGEFTGHVEAVLRRIKASDGCSDYNGPHQRMAGGAAKLGYSMRRAMLNLDPERYDPARAGHTGFGDSSGAKQGTVRTFLQDASDGGARVVVGCRAERVLVGPGGAAAGVLARRGEGGAASELTVRAPLVVLACGALETPALLLRSGVGGPAAGDHLRLHPAGAVTGIYEEDQRAWWGPAQAAIVDEFAELQDGFGFLIEGTHFTTGLAAAASPWRSGVEHKTLLRSGGRAASLILLLRDRGQGRVSLAPDGEGLHWYPLDDELDQRHFRRGLAEVARIHEAAGAAEIFGLHPGVPPWRRGDDLDDWIERLTTLPLGAGGQPVFSAHQMGTARMGTDPATSAANPLGELHGTGGVWIGDTSAFPTALGVNPMVTCQALARRTAHAILAARR
jgi:choline dehydrogenase-like flavoprotein